VTASASRGKNSWQYWTHPFPKMQKLYTPCVDARYGCSGVCAVQPSRAELLKPLRKYVVMSQTTKKYILPSIQRTQR
jgi:hypothetical protein